MSAQDYKDNDNQWTIVRKILQNLYGIVSGTLPIPITPGSIGAPTTGANVTVVTAGTAVLAIAANSKGYISVPATAGGLIYVGDSTIGNASGGKIGIVLTQAGLSPLLSGPVYVNSDTSGDVLGVTTL